MAQSISLFGTLKEVVATSLRSVERVVHIADQGTMYALEASKVARLEAVCDLELDESMLVNFENKLKLLERIK